MEGEIILISDSDEEAVPSSQVSTSIVPSSASVLGLSTLSIKDIKTISSFETPTGMAMYKPLGADLMAARQLEAMKKKKLSIMQPFPVVRDVVNKMRSTLGTNNSQLNVLGLAQQYITSLKYYQASIVNCPNRCRLLARHIIQTMCLIRDLSRHFFDSPHYSQKISELLSIYIYFELQCAGDFKDSKGKIAERIVHNIHLHLESAKSNFVLRIFSFLSNMGKESEIATKVFQRLIPEVTLMVKNEFPDRLFVQYLIVFYHWKESMNDYEDQQKVVAFANKFMKPMSTIKTNKIYAKHLPCYVKRDDATGYFLTNMVFFNDLRNASILDGIQENGPALVDLSEDEKVYPIIDLSQYTMEKIYPLINIKVERRENDETVDLTNDDEDSWLKRLVHRAVALEVILPARLTTRSEHQDPAVIELNDSDSENANENNVENENEDHQNENDNEDDDSWAFGPGSEKQQQQQERPLESFDPANGESNSMDEIYNELNSSIDFADDSTTESEIAKKNEQKERFEVASKLTDAQARITFDGVVEKELKAMFLQSTSSSSKAPADATTDKKISCKPVADTSSNAVELNNQPTIPIIVSVCGDTTLSKAAVASEITASIETDAFSTKNSTSAKTKEDCAKLNSLKTDAAGEDQLNLFEAAPLIKPIVIEKSSVLISEAVQAVQKNIIEKAMPTDTAIVVVGQNAGTLNVDKTLNNSVNNKPVGPILLQGAQAPKEDVTFTMDDKLLSSFDSSDESDEDFLGRFQQPPFKTYLRRAHRKSSKKTTKINTSSSEDDVNATIAEKMSLNESENNKPSTSQTLPSNDATNDNANVLFSGKVISLREDESSNGAGGATPNYLNISESVEVSKHGSNVVFSMQGRRLSSFPPLNVTNDQGLADFDAEISMTGKEDSNSRKKKSPKRKTVKKSNIVKNQISLNGSDKHQAKAKSVWFAERAQIREIERRISTTSQQNSSPINTINSTINKISATKQHFASKIFSSQSTTSASTKTSAKTKSKFKTCESNKISKSNHSIKRRLSTTESSTTTAALKSAQEKDLLQLLFPEAFATPKKADKQISNAKGPALLKTAISSSRNYKLNNKNLSNGIKNRQESVNSQYVRDIFGNKSRKRRKSSSTCSDKQSHSDFDKYLQRKKLLKPPKPSATPKTKNKTPKTEKTKTKRPRKSKKNMALIANDPKLGSQMKPIVVLNHVSGPVFILKSGISSETYTEVRPDVFKLEETTLPMMATAKKIHDIRRKSLIDILSDAVVQKMTATVPKEKESSVDKTISVAILANDGKNIEKQPAAGAFKLKKTTSPMMAATAKKIPEIRTKSLSDILSDAVVQEMAAAVAEEKEIPENNAISVAIMADDANVDKQPKPKQVDPCLLPAPAAVTVSEKLPLQEREKEEEDKIEQLEIVPLSNAAVKSQDELELKLIKKEEMELKSLLPEMTANASPSKTVLGSFKKPTKSMVQKRLASASFIHGTTKCVKAPKSSPILPIGQEEASFFSEIVPNRDVQEPVTSTNNHLFPPLTSESESDLSCRTELTSDIESSEQCDSSQFVVSPTKSVKVRLRRQTVVQKQSYYSSVMVESKTKGADGSRKRRERKNLGKKGEALQRIFERGDSLTASASSNQQSPQSDLINGVLVPSIEAMNTPPPTPPTTGDDKSSVTDDTSQESKSQTAPDSSNIHQSHPPVIYKNGENVHNSVNKIDVQSSNIPPINIRENYENLQVHANQVPNFNSLLLNVSLPSRNRKRLRKKSTTDASDNITSKGTSRSQLKKRRKTICTDVFSPPDISSDEEIYTPGLAAGSPTMHTYRYARSVKSSRLFKKIRQEESASVRVNKEEISLSLNDLCDSLLSCNHTSTTSMPVVESEKIESEESPCSSKSNSGSPSNTSRNLAVSRTYSKKNMVQQVFVPPEIEMCIEEPSKLAVEVPTTFKMPSSSNRSVTQSRPSCSNQTKKTRKKITKIDEDESKDDDPRDMDYQVNSRKSLKHKKTGKKRGARRGKRLH